MDEITSPDVDQATIDRRRELLEDDGIGLSDEEVDLSCGQWSMLSHTSESARRSRPNLSLSTQLKACEEYCQRQGFGVLARFREEGESAKTADRTELQKLLQYCRLHKGRVQFVVVFNLTRFAREKYDHFALRAHLKSLGISLSAFYRARRTCGCSRR